MRRTRRGKREFGRDMRAVAPDNAEDRGVLVNLPPTESRCCPGCEVRDKCARYLADIPSRHAVISDFEATNVHGSRCEHYLTVQQANELSAPVVGPTIHEAVKGLS